MYSLLHIAGRILSHKKKIRDLRYYKSHLEEETYPVMETSSVDRRVSTNRWSALCNIFAIALSTI